ncbi:MAG: hypothetical protein PHI59_04110 [Candidatus Omnitrophica bacterium]|nr:hypothetical protein [Candidatus Omnitrophota bacterium]
MVYVIFPKDKRTIEKFKGMPWSYLGADEGLYEAEAILGGNKREFIGKGVERIVSSVRGNYIDYIGQISTLQKDKVLWYSSRVPSKSSSQMAMFNQYVYIKFIESYAVSGGNHLFLADDLQLLANLKRFRLPGIEVQGRIAPDYMKMALKKITGGWQFFKYFFYWLVFRLFLSSGNPKKGDILLHSFIDSRVFSKLPGYNDPYFGGLEDFLNKNAQNVFRITPLFVDFIYAFKLKKYFKNISLLLSYLKPADFFRIFFTRMSIERGLPAGSGIKDKELLDFLLKNEEKNENETNGFQAYLFYYYCYRNLAEKLPDGASVIYTFENQPWEKMLNLALSKNFKKIAYQHMTIPINWLDYHVSVFEKNMPLPEVILASGRIWLDFLRNYYSSCQIEDAGAIRLKYIFSAGKERPLRKTNTIVVALSIFPEVTIALQRQVLACLATGEFSEYKFLVKPHPYSWRSALLTKEFLKYDNCELTGKDIKLLLEDCCLLVTSASTVAFEALSLGVKTLYFIPETISIGLEYFIREYLEIAFADNFKEKLLTALKTTEYPVFNVKEFFSPADYSVFLKQVTFGIGQGTNNNEE